MRAAIIQVDKAAASWFKALVRKDTAFTSWCVTRAGILRELERAGQVPIAWAAFVLHPRAGEFSPARVLRNCRMGSAIAQRDAASRDPAENQQL